MIRKVKLFWHVLRMWGRCWQFRHLIIIDDDTRYYTLSVHIKRSPAQDAVSGPDIITSVESPFKDFAKSGEPLPAAISLEDIKSMRLCKPEWHYL